MTGKSTTKKIIFLISIVFFISGCLQVDDSSLKAGDGSELGKPRFASGPEYGTYFPFAKGIIDAGGQSLGIFMENVATEGTLQNAKLLVSGDNFMGEAYLGLVQEDIFRYARDTNEAQYNQYRTVDKTLLKIASRLKVLLALYEEDVHLLVNTDANINKISDLAGKKVNIGSLNSGTFITASTILKAYNLYTQTQNDDAAVGIQKVVSGEYDAAFYVTASPSAVLLAIPKDSKVKLIQVQMPANQKIYNENGVITSESYGFQKDNIAGNVSVKTLLVHGPNFNDANLRIFLDYIFSHLSDYKKFNQKWENISLSKSKEYMQTNPEVSNFKAMSYVTGYQELDPFYIEPLFYSESGISSYHDMSVELIFLLSHNLNLNLRERNSTGSFENAYRVLTGLATMALVQDDIFSYLRGYNEIDYSMMLASMKKVVPLHYEYLHLLVNKNQFNTGQLWRQWNPVINTWSHVVNVADGWTAGQTYPRYLKDIFVDPAPLNDSEPKLHINVGPKTSGTFITAMKVINSYRLMKTGTSDVPDMERMEIYFHFDPPDVAIQKVKSGEYHAAFVVSGVPYNRFYSHDTWDVTTALANCVLIPATFFDEDRNGNSADNTPYPYLNGTLSGSGDFIYENYPYSASILPMDITTVRVRAMQVVSAAYVDSNLEVFIKSVFRKSYYKTNPADPADWVFNGGDFQPEQLWVPVQKENAAKDLNYGRYEEIIGAKEYFIKNPFNWTNGAVNYYLSLFPDN